MKLEPVTSSAVLRSFGLEPRTSPLKRAGAMVGLVGLGVAIGTAASWAVRHGVLEGLLGQRTLASPPRPTAPPVAS